MAWATTAKATATASMTDKDDNEGNDADYNNDDDHHHDPPPATTQGKRLMRRTCAWHATMWHA